MDNIIKPKVTIIGSITKSEKKIQEAACFFQALGFSVKNPLTNNEETENDTLFDIQLRYIRYITSADCICLVKKDDGSIGESTSYELAIAAYNNIPICVWDGGGKYYDEKTKTINWEGK